MFFVPIAEEVAYRGYLMRRLTSPDFESIPLTAVRLPAILVTAVVFGLAHGALWLPGIAAGVAYGLLVVRRGTIGEAVAAHATTNALVAVTVLTWDQWQFCGRLKPSAVQHMSAQFSLFTCRYVADQRHALLA